MSIKLALLASALVLSAPFALGSTASAGDPGPAAGKQFASLGVAKATPLTTQQASEIRGGTNEIKIEGPNGVITTQTLNVDLYDKLLARNGTGQTLCFGTTSGVFGCNLSPLDAPVHVLALKINK